MPIKILIADDNQDTKDTLKELFSSDDSIEVVDTASDGLEAIDLAKTLSPDLIIMDINMPVMNGLDATERLSIEQPDVSVIIISVQNEPEYLRKSMLAGAKDYLTKPFNPAELLNTIHKIYDREQRKKSDDQDEDKIENNTGKIFTFFSTKGGCGKTTLVVNIALALKKIYPEKKVAIIDSKLQFGDVSLLLNLTNPSTIYDLVNDDTIDFDILERYFTEHSSGISVLSCPEPRYAEEIKPEFLGKILAASIQSFDFVFIDTSPIFREIELQILDATNGYFFLVLTPEVTALKNTNETLQIISDIGFSKEKLRVLLNRSKTNVALTNENIEKTLGLNIFASFPSEGNVTVPALNTGKPFVLSNPDANISKAIFSSIAKLFDLPERKNSLGIIIMDKLKNILR